MRKYHLKYWWTLLYFVVYLLGFFLIERLTGTVVHDLTTSFDRHVPFISHFIYFYYLWFPFIFYTFVRLFFDYKEDYLKMITFLYTGMTLFVLVSAIYPNGLSIRPVLVHPKNISEYLVSLIYMADTPTNVLPSIHVYNSIGMAIAIYSVKTLPVYERVGSLFLGIMITISTVFVKQHGIIDVLSALILAYIMYVIVYKKEFYFLKRNESV